MTLPTRIELRVGEEYVLRLKGLAAAGYIWQYSITGPEDVVSVSLQMAGEAPQGDQEGSILPGASRDELATIQALQPGHVTIDFVQRRPWEQEGPPLEEHRLEVQVEA